MQQGLYDPRFEHDSCGVGFVARISGAESNEILRMGLVALSRLAHRGAGQNKPLYLGHPEFEGFEVIQTVTARRRGG